MSYYINIDGGEKKVYHIKFFLFPIVAVLFFPTGSFSSSALPYMPFSTNKALIKAHSRNNLFNLNIKYLSIIVVHRVLNNYIRIYKFSFVCKSRCPGFIFGY